MKTHEDVVLLSKKIEINSIFKYNDHVIVHKLSHKHLHTTFWILEVATLAAEGIPISEIHKLPVPVLIEKFISNFTPFKK